jgi:hypothetical protein
VAGAALFVLTDFLYLSVTRYATGGVGSWSSWSWQKGAELWWWTHYWTALAHLGGGGFRVWFEWAGVDLFLHACTVLCVVAAVLALRRGLGGAPVNAGLIRTFGIVAAAGVVAATLCWAVLSPGYQQLALTEIVQLGGAVLIIVGAHRTQRPATQDGVSPWYGTGQPAHGATRPFV